MATSAFSDETFDFDELTERQGTLSVKWDTANDPSMIPVWIADMDFKTAPAVQRAVIDRAVQGIYGYTRVPQAYFGAICSWFSRRHGWKINPDWILYTTGVVPAISASVKAVTKPGDKVVISTPVYTCFFSSIRNNGCEIVECPLSPDGDSRAIDWTALENAFADPQVAAYLLCNPHNPGGHVWTENELSRIATLAKRHGVFVISDEIHGEFVFGKTPYTPFAAISEHDPEHCVTLSSASKTFNLAGLQNAFIVAESEAVRRRIDRAINDNECCDVNPFGVQAVIAAFNEGEAWLEALLSYLRENARTGNEWFKKECPRVKLAHPEGTYFLWADCRFLGLPSQAIEDELRRVEKVWVSAGTHYGQDGEGFIRINLATQRSRLMQALKRITTGLNRLSES